MASSAILAVKDKFYYNKIMIIVNSKDPVFVKKIYLKHWLLQDEIESISNYAIKNNSKLSEVKELLKNEYKQGEVDNSKLRLVKSNNNHLAKEEEVEEELEYVIQRSSSDLPEEKIGYGVIILSEIEMDKISFFSNKKYIIGQTIVIEFQVPNFFSIQGEVTFCVKGRNTSNIIAKKRYSTRVVVNCIFKKKGERTLLRNFIKSIEPEIPIEIINKKEGDEGDEDDLSGLDP